MTVKENIENRITKLKEDKDRAEHCEMPDRIYAAELQCAIVELQNVLRFIDNNRKVNKMNDIELIVELLKRADEEWNKQAKEFAIAKLESVKADIEQCYYNDNNIDGVIIFKRDIDDLFNEHIAALKGENKC